MPRIKIQVMKGETLDGMAYMVGIKRKKGKIFKESDRKLRKRIKDKITYICNVGRCT